MSPQQEPQNSQSARKPQSNLPFSTVAPNIIGPVEKRVLEIGTITPFIRTLLDDFDAVSARETLGLNGSPIRLFTTVTTTYAALLTDDIILCNGGGAFTVTLPNANLGKQFILKKIDNNVATVTIATNDSATLDGSSTDAYSLAQQYNMVVYACDGTNWHNIGTHYDAL